MNPPSRPRLSKNWALAAVLAAFPCTLSAKEPVRSLVKPELIGKIAPNRYLIPTNQVLTPAGRQVELPKMRPQALALSPDGKLLVATGKTSELVTIDPATGNILQRVALPGKNGGPPSKIEHPPNSRPTMALRLSLSPG